MNLLFLIAMIVELVFGLGFTLVPGTLMGLMGLTLDPVATTITRLLGSALLAFAILLYFARRTTKPELKYAVLVSLLAYYLLSMVILLISQFTIQMVPMIWGVIGLHLLFTIWFGYYLVKKA